MIGRDYSQQATYWAATGESLYGAQNAFGSPVVLLVHWEDRQEQAMDAKGHEFMTQAVVFVPQAVAIGGFLALGDRSSEVDPTALSGAYEIKKLVSIPDIRNVVTERRAFL